MTSTLSDSLDTLFTSIGILGMLIILFAYFMLQLTRWQPHAPRYLCANILGSLCLIASLIWSWNLPLFLLQCTWILISGYGLIKYYKDSKESKTS